ncbi:MAG: hypothetical protein B1H11_06395 [Desulfobacteraceae bacterium 4484_190.1]|nr:MAG: hypothetical protein B1H11_06395 [Desulfobacteraceae bacterium 4484_190.1]
MELQRILNLPNLLSRKSFFLFGPRATGKSTPGMTNFKPCIGNNFWTIYGLANSQDDPLSSDLRLLISAFRLLSLPDL